MSKRIFAILILVWLTLSLNGCRAVQRRKATVKKVVHSTETGTRKIITKGDSVVFIPRIKYINDTITNIHKNVIVKTYYKQGKVDKVVCKQKEQEIIENYIKQQTAQTKTTNKEVTKDPIKSIWFLYFGIIIIIGIVVNNLTKK